MRLLEVVSQSMKTGWPSSASGLEEIGFFENSI
jgi:hypothetical protein